MNTVLIERIIPEDEVLRIIREVRLTNHQEVQPYRDARIAFSDTATFVPSTFYALEESLAFIRELREKVLALGYDVFALNGGLELSVDGGAIRQMVPPIVEMTPEGQPILLDGIHRAIAARDAGLPLTVLTVENVDPEWPAYAKANPNGWDDLHVVAEVPPVKKLYRDLPERGLTYRDLYRAIPGSSGIRKVGEK